MKTMRLEGEINFINVDVEIFASFDLKPLLKKLKPKVVKMYCDQYDEDTYLLALELSKCKKKDTPETIIKRFCDLFEKKAKDTLKKSNKVIFDIGFDSGTKPNSLRSFISNKTMKRISKLNGQLAITIYPLIQEDSRNKHE